MKMDKTSVAAVIVLILLNIFIFYIGDFTTEARLEKMAKEKGIIFLNKNAYKITPIKIEERTIK